jgi:hypothetical protein
MKVSKRSLKNLSRFSAVLVFLQCISILETSAGVDWEIKKSEWRKPTGGYLANISNERGISVPVYVSCPAESYTLTVLKVGNFSGAETKQVKKSNEIKCIDQEKKKALDWKSNFTLDTAELAAGMYLIRILDSDRFKSFIPLIIRDDKRKTRAIFVIPTMTMFAYNSWSGRNTYKGVEGFEDRSKVVDFRQPFDSGFGTGKYWSYVHPLIVQIEKTGLDITYLADTDIHFNPELLNNRTLYISAGHDEYWTKQERESVIRARLNGMNLIFFGANAGYWQSRLKRNNLDNSIVMEIYKSKDLDPNKVEPTIRFREAGYSETELNGVQYTCFPARGDFHSFDKTFFGFKGLTTKDFIGLGKLLGPEVDEVPGVSKFKGTIKVVAEGKVKCGNRWIFPKIGRASMVYGTSKVGGGVFSVATMGWVLTGMKSGAEKSLNNFVTTVTNNVVRRGIEGPFK